MSTARLGFSELYDKPKKSRIGTKPCLNGSKCYGVVRANSKSGLCDGCRNRGYRRAHPRGVRP